MPYFLKAGGKRRCFPIFFTRARFVSPETPRPYTCLREICQSQSLLNGVRDAWKRQDKRDWRERYGMKLWFEVQRISNLEAFHFQPVPLVSPVSLVAPTLLALTHSLC